MAPSDNQALDDELLKRYLLGALPEADTERLHELSVTDEELAGRLDAVENDLVDAYVRGELPQEDLNSFKSFYLSSPKRREKVGVAEGLLALERRAVAARASNAAPAGFAAPAGIEEAAGESSPARASRDRSGWRAPRFRFQWGLAAACLALLLAGGYLLIQNLELRKQVGQAQSQHVPDPRIQELEKQLEEERAARNEAVKELERGRESQVNLDQLKTVAVLLPPPTRSAGPAPTISLHPGADLVVLVLPLEADDFPAYQARLKDPRTRHVLWTSARLTAARGDERKSVSISFRAGLLQQQNYIVDLTGIPSQGTSEVIGGYPFRVVLK